MSRPVAANNTAWWHPAICFNAAPADLAKRGDDLASTMLRVWFRVIYHLTHDELLTT
jgi:hypothetical protein